MLKDFAQAIADGPELNFIIHDNLILFVPRILILLADLLEASKMANVY